MTAIVFVMAGAFGIWWFGEFGREFIGGVSIFVAMFLATLSSASLAALYSRNRRCVFGALVLVASFVASHYAWHLKQPEWFPEEVDFAIFALSIVNFATGTWFAVTGVRKWEFTIAVLYLLDASLGAIMSDAIMERPQVFMAVSFADVNALLKHAANITLGVGAGDAGKLARVVGLGPPWRAPAGRSLVRRVASMASGSTD